MLILKRILVTEPVCDFPYSRHNLMNMIQIMKACQLGWNFSPIDEYSWVPMHANFEPWTFSTNNRDHISLKLMIIVCYTLSFRRICIHAYNGSYWHAGRHMGTQHVFTNFIVYIHIACMITQLFTCENCPYCWHNNIFKWVRITQIHCHYSRHLFCLFVCV